MVVAPRVGPLGDRSLKHDVYAAIVARIHRGELRPGDRVSEADVAARLGISRAPVREALSLLAYEGLIVRKPRSGNFIAELTQQDIEDIREARVLLEGHAARRACLRITGEDAAELRALIAAMATAAVDPVDPDHWTTAASLNAQFHLTVARIAGNRVLERLWRVLDPLAWLLAPATRTNWEHSPNDLVARHELLLNALLEGDPDKAQAAFAAHIMDASRLTTGISADGSPPAQDRREVSA
jgi:DNA-binding GntR family transcriptional regulator